MINSNVYDYINVLGKTADAAWVRNEVLGNNIANVDTPGYKRQDVDFESQLNHALGRMKYKDMDEKVSSVTSTELKSRVYTDSANFAYRIDGNNVDIDTENVELAANQIKYNGLVQSINQEFTNLKMVIK